MSKKIGFKTADRIFAYCEDSGVLTWKINYGKNKVGEPTSSWHMGRYPSVWYKSNQYLVHRVIWLLKTGKFPKRVIDHIDGDPTNNRWTNLRHVTVAQNLHNRSTPNKNNTHGFMGVTRNGKGFLASVGVTVNGKQKIFYLGTYKTPEEAHTAYIAGKKKHQSGYVA